MLNSIFGSKDPYADLFDSYNKSLTQIITEKLKECPLGGDKLSKLFKELNELDAHGNPIPFELLSYKRYGATIKLALPVPKEQAQLCLVSWFVTNIAVYLSNQRLIKKEWGVELGEDFLYLTMEKVEK